MASNPDLTAADLTLGEKAQIAVLIARMARRGLGGEHVDIRDLQRRVERIEQRALRRKHTR